jgi:hypothetical protein
MQLLIPWIFLDEHSIDLKPVCQLANRILGENNGVGRNCAQLQDTFDPGGRHNEGAEVQAIVRFGSD